MEQSPKIDTVPNPERITTNAEANPERLTEVTTKSRSKTQKRVAKADQKRKSRNINNTMLQRTQFRSTSNILNCMKKKEAKNEVRKKNETVVEPQNEQLEVTTLNANLPGMPSLKSKVKKKTVEERKIIHAQINEATKKQTGMSKSKKRRARGFRVWLKNLDALVEKEWAEEQKRKEHKKTLEDAVTKLKQAQNILAAKAEYPWLEKFLNKEGPVRELSHRTQELKKFFDHCPEQEKEKIRLDRLNEFFILRSEKKLRKKYCGYQSKYTLEKEAKKRKLQEDQARLEAVLSEYEQKNTIMIMDDLDEEKERKAQETSMKSRVKSQSEKQKTKLEPTILEEVDDVVQWMEEARYKIYSKESAALLSSTTASIWLKQSELIGAEDPGLAAHFEILQFMTGVFSNKEHKLRLNTFNRYLIFSKSPSSF
jgi:hypothetical protein